MSLPGLVCQSRWWDQPGTGKSSIARLIATETERIFYQITPADMFWRRGLEKSEVKVPDQRG